MGYEKYLIMDGDKKLSGWLRLDWACDALDFYISHGLTAAHIVTIH